MSPCDVLASQYLGPLTNYSGSTRIKSTGWGLYIRSFPWNIRDSRSPAMSIGAIRGVIPGRGYTVSANYRLAAGAFIRGTTIIGCETTSGLLRSAISTISGAQPAVLNASRRTFRAVSLTFCAHILLSTFPTSAMDPLEADRTHDKFPHLIWDGFEGIRSFET